MNLPRRVVIVGAGGHGSEVVTYVQDLVRSGWKGELLGFLDDAVAARETIAPVRGMLTVFQDSPLEFFHDLSYLTAVGDNATRRRIVARLKQLYADRMTPWTLLHPSVHIGPQVEVGAGTCLAPGSIVTCRTQVGSHCIINVKASISHDCLIGDFVNVNPGVTVCGSVTIDDGAYVGAGATIREGVTIGADSVVGAGAVVIGDVPPNVTVVGVPARVVRRHLAT